MTPLISQNSESLFQKTKRILSLPPDFDPGPADPWTAEEELAELGIKEAREQATIQ